MPKISEINARDLVPGIAGRYVHGDKASFGVINIRKGSILPLHHHPHEQITYILKGELEMEIGGTKVLLTPGSYFVIHSDVPHAAVALTDCEVIDVFSPVREEYR